MGKISNLRSLEREMELLELRIRDIEHKMDRNIDDLRENYGMMAFNSVIGPQKKEKIHNFWSNMAEKIMDHPRIHRAIGKWVEKVVDKLDPDGAEPPAAKGSEPTS